MCPDGVHDPVSLSFDERRGGVGCAQAAAVVIHEIVQRVGEIHLPDRLALERWTSEGGHIAPEAVIERETVAGNAESVRATWQGHCVDDPTSKIAPSFRSQGANP